MSECSSNLIENLKLMYPFFQTEVKEEKKDQETREEIKNALISFSSEYVAKIIQFAKVVFKWIYDSCSDLSEYLKLGIKYTWEIGHFSIVKTIEIFKNCNFIFCLKKVEIHNHYLIISDTTRKFVPLDFSSYPD